MGKQKGQRRRRKNSKHEEDSDEDNGDSSKCEIVESTDLTFAQKRDLQRKAAAEKRRQKMKCHLCGKRGHLRRECPGIADDGKGASKYTKSNGDAGATHLKGRKNRSNSHGSYSHAEEALLETILSGFGNDLLERESGFAYFDAGIGDPKTTVDYLRFGRHGHGGHGQKKPNHHNHTQLSHQDAVSEYDAAMEHACSTTNFGGGIVRSALPLDFLDESFSWKPQDSYPFSWHQDTPSELKFVIGYSLGEDEDCDSDQLGGSSNISDMKSEAIVERLVQIARGHPSNIVGFYADLDYTSLPTEQQPTTEDNCRTSQLKRLRTTLVAAKEIGYPIQIRLLPGYTTATNHSTKQESSSSSLSETNYALAIRDIGTIFLEASPGWKVHLSCWNGNPDHLVALTKAFSNETEVSSSGNSNVLCFGLDGSLGFSKARHLHESAFELRPDQFVLETGGPQVVPPVVAKANGRSAFCHSGHLPLVAHELAKHMAKNPMIATYGLPEEEDNTPREITAERVARWACATTKALYGLQ